MMLQSSTTSFPTPTYGNTLWTAESAARAIRLHSVGMEQRVPSHPPCNACGAVIHERYFVKVMDKTYHERCLRCSVCRQQLSVSCFYKHDQFYCRMDYHRFFGAKCSSCAEPIPSTELVMRAMANVYHLRCFACAVCRRQLQRGDEYVLENNRIYCKQDCQRMQRQQTGQGKGALSSLHHYPPPSIPSTTMQPPFPIQYPIGLPGPMDHHQQRPVYGRPLRPHEEAPFGFSVPGPKRPRTILTGNQRHLFKATFEQNPKPTRKVREKLSQETGLSVRVVQVWFQNQRAKVKKLSKKGRSESISSQMSGDGSPGGGDTKGGSKGGERSREGTSGSDESVGDLTMASGSPALQPGVPSLVHSEPFMVQVTQGAAAATTGNTVITTEPVIGTGMVEGQLQAFEDDQDPLQLLHSMQSHYFSEQT